MFERIMFSMSELRRSQFVYATGLADTAFSLLALSLLLRGLYS